MHEQDLLCITDSVFFYRWYINHIETYFYPLGTVLYRLASLYCVDEYYILILLLTVSRGAEGSCNHFVILSKICFI